VEDVVAVSVPRSAEWLALVLGVWKTGAVYLPIDATQPPERLAMMLTDAQVATHLRELPAVDGLPTASPAGTLSPANAASGSPATTRTSTSGSSPYAAAMSNTPNANDMIPSETPSKTTTASR
ncbi:AMP-binding protein, partial [Kibdelosporangium lantanae]